MDNLKFRFLGSLILIVLAYTSGCSPQKENGYRIGSQINVFAELTTNVIEPQILVYKHPRQYDYERANDSKFWIEIDNKENINITLKNVFSDLGDPTIKRPYYAIMEVFIKEKYLAENPEIDKYTVHLVGMRRADYSDKSERR